jgi:branched-chain amino acid transport system substrate-binding protein
MLAKHLLKGSRREVVETAQEERIKKQQIKKKAKKERKNGTKLSLAPVAAICKRQGLCPTQLMNRMIRWLLTLVIVVGLGGSAIVIGQTGADKTGVTDTEIKIGGFIAQSGPVASIGIPVARGATAYYNTVNELGGIHGRKIKFIACDDAFNPAQTVACIKRLTEEEKVFAIVHGLGTVPHFTVFQQLSKTNIPVVSPHANALFLSSPTTKNYFALQPTNAAFATALVNHAVTRLGKRKIALIFQNDAFGNELRTAALARMKDLGIEPVADIAHAPTDTNFNPFVLRLRSANPEVVMLFTLLVPSASILKESETIGFKPQWMATNVQTDLTLFRLAGLSAVEGMIATGFAVDPCIRDNVAAKNFRDRLAKYFPGDIPSGFSEIAYVGAQLFSEALLLAGKDLTREGFMAAMERVKDFRAEGLVPPITYTATDHRGIKDIFIIQAVRGNDPRIQNVARASDAVCQVQGDAGAFVLLEEVRNP